MDDSGNQVFDILESALDHAFSAPPPPETLQPEASSAVEETVVSEVSPNNRPEPSAEPSAETSTSDDSWKEEYEAQVQSWRAQSAEAREKAEKERLKWEAIRAIEREEAAKRKAVGIVDEPLPVVSQTPSEIWESVGELSTTTTVDSSRPAGLGGIEENSKHLPSTRTGLPIGLPRTHSHQTATDELQKWEDVPSVTSSYPSMSFPEHLETPHSSQPQPTSQHAPVSVTLAIFDSTLSTRTRLTAFFSSLAVNLLLPFVNGVMLGFGEIVAKNVIMGWFGWKSSAPASTVTNVGLRASSREERQKNSVFR